MVPYGIVPAQFAGRTITPELIVAMSMDSVLVILGPYLAEALPQAAASSRPGTPDMPRSVRMVMAA